MLFLSLLCCAASSCSRHDGTNTTADRLVGTWTTSVTFGPRVRGEIRIDLTTDAWRARAGGFDVAVQHDGDTVHFALPDRLGEFRGRIGGDATVLVGQWIQPPGVVHFSGYATPVNLRRAGSSWIGQVTPLEDAISFHVRIGRARDGSLVADIRNPQFNWLGRTRYAVRAEGESVTVAAGRTVITGHYDRQHDLLVLPLLDLTPPVAPLRLKRSSERDVAGLLPRATAGSYTYHQPESVDDGWQTATLAAVDIDQRPIASLIDAVLKADPGDPHAMRVHSILVARHGKLALEEYFYGTSRDDPHDMRSAGKTWAPMLVAVARAHGARIDPATRVVSLFPRYRPFANLDARKSRMTVEDIMTMRSGLACDDNDDSSPGNENNMQSQSAQPDWYKFTLDLPMARDPGGNRGVYCSATLNLAGGAAREASATGLADLFAEGIARPLDFGLYHLNLMPTGEVYMGGGAYIRPRDQLKLGQVYLDGGVWKGRRVIDAGWVAASIAPHAQFTPVNDIDTDHAYGYGWHLHHFVVNGRDYREYSAEGNGGQMVMVVPDLDMVVTITAGNYGDSSWYRWALRILPEYLIPAAH